MKKCLLSLSFAVTVLAAFCQSSEEPLKFRKNIGLDLLGGGLLANLSFDMRLQKGVQDGFGVRVGIGGLSVSGATVTTTGGTTTNSGTASIGIITFPIEANYLVGKKRSSFETGVGVLTAYVGASGEVVNNNNERTSFDFKGFGFGAVYLKVGYRFQPLANGITFNFAYTPLINSNGFQSWIGLGIGFSFR
jgi:hypothetical protein